MTVRSQEKQSENGHVGADREAQNGVSFAVLKSFPRTVSVWSESSFMSQLSQTSWPTKRP